jgi:transcriptional antiterminator NusG
MDEDRTPQPGDTVVVIDGPFADFEGIVETINEEMDRVRVKISFFGRDTPVELHLSDIKKSD